MKRSHEFGYRVRFQPHDGSRPAQIYAYRKTLRGAESCLRWARRNFGRVYGYWIERWNGTAWVPVEEGGKE